jgi:hypothetical protein
MLGVIVDALHTAHGFKSILNEAGNLRRSNSTQAKAQLKDAHTALVTTNASFNYVRHFNLHKCHEIKPHSVQDACLHDSVLDICPIASVNGRWQTS